MSPRRSAPPRRIMFVCFGNICRSPMAEMVFRHLADEAGAGEAFEVSSAATGCEEGRPVHPGTLDVLRRHGVPAYTRRSVLLLPEDADRYNLFVGMDARNARAMRRILGEGAAEKICLLLDFTDEPRDIADPWYTGDFEAAYRDVSAGAAALLQRLIGEENNEAEDQ